jgi:arsenite methyltransferase
MKTESDVKARYSQSARAREEALCCPVQYSSELLELLPREIIEKDYGCGDPSRYVREGDVVLDLGSGGGKICYMAAQIVGNRGYVIGVDMTDEMLDLARKYQAEMARRLGSERVRFAKAHIQDLALDLEALDRYLAGKPVRSHDDYSRLREWELRQRAERPLIADRSIDLVISNCVLNLVGLQDRDRLMSEIYRVLKPGGRVAISDIVSDKTVPGILRQDPALWSGCISGAFQEEEFVQAFAAAGFCAVKLDRWNSAPWRIVNGIEFRSVTLTAVKAVDGESRDRGHAVVYRGPFKRVRDDAGQCYQCGVRVPVSEPRFRMLTGGSYGDDFIGITPAVKHENTRGTAAGNVAQPSHESGDAATVCCGDGGTCC